MQAGRHARGGRKREKARSVQLIRYIRDGKGRMGPRRGKLFPLGRPELGSIAGLGVFLLEATAYQMCVVLLKL